MFIIASLDQNHYEPLQLHKRAYFRSLHAPVSPVHLQFLLKATLFHQDDLGRITVK